VTDTKLIIENVSAHYEPEKPVLSEVSLEVADGEVVALLGPSGCGKSTLLLLIGGFLFPASGNADCLPKQIPHGLGKQRWKTLPIR
jgi:ABC-type Fe3+/spermidine/putrescine transport system ATPase subunit